VLKRPFTLIEIVVVLVIMMLVTGIAVASLRGESPAAAIGRTSQELEAYLAKVRYRCAESGRDYVVRYYPDRKIFCAHMDYSDEELENMERDVVDSGASEIFKFSDDIEVFTVESAEEETTEHEYVELFRFYPSGGASCINRPGIRIEKLAKFFDISFFSGQLIISDGDGEDTDKK